MRSSFAARHITSIAECHLDTTLFWRIPIQLQYGILIFWKQSGQTVFASSFRPTGLYFDAAQTSHELMHCGCLTFLKRVFIIFGSSLPLFWRLYVCHNISCFMPVGTCILRRDREFLLLLILVLDSTLGKHYSCLCCRRNRMITIVHAVRSINDDAD